MTDTWRVLMTMTSIRGERTTGKTWLKIEARACSVRSMHGHVHSRHDTHELVSLRLVSCVRVRNVHFVPHFWLAPVHVYVYMTCTCHVELYVDVDR